MFIKSNNITVQQAQHICTAPIQRRTSVEDVEPTCPNATQMPCARLEEVLSPCLFCTVLYCKVKYP